jgi:hypothetical protein
MINIRPISEILLGQSGLHAVVEIISNLAKERRGDLPDPSFVEIMYTKAQPPKYPFPVLPLDIAESCLVRKQEMRPTMFMTHRQGKSRKKKTNENAPILPQTSLVPFPIVSSYIHAFLT